MAETSKIQYTEAGIHFGGEFVLWEQVDAARNAFRFHNSVLVKVGFTYGRVSDIEDAEIFDKDEWAKIKAALTGTTAWYSDFAGKHSETSITFWENVDLKEITELDKITKFHAANGLSSIDLGIIEQALTQAIENGEITEEYEKITEE